MSDESAPRGHVGDTAVFIPDPIPRRHHDDTPELILIVAVVAVLAFIAWVRG